MPHVFCLQMTLHHLNQEKSVASVCHWVAAWVPEMFYNLYLVKNQKIADYSATIEAKEKK